MNSHPPKVLYEELPERPFKVFYNKTLVAEEDPNAVSTPRRKTRISKGSAIRRRTKKWASFEGQEKADSTGRISESVSVPDIFDVVETEGVYFGDMCTWPRAEEPLTYASFVEAVLSDECSIYQVTQKVFIANGWDTVKNEATVSLQLLRDSDLAEKVYLACVVSHPEGFNHGRIRNSLPLCRGQEQFASLRSCPVPS